MCLLLEEVHYCVATYFHNWLLKLNWCKGVHFQSIIWFPSLENMQMRLWKLKQSLLPRLQHKPKAFIWMDNRLLQIGSAGVWSLGGVQIPSSSCNIFHINKLKPLLLTPLLGKYVDIVIINLRKIWSPHLTTVGLSWLIQANSLAPACLFIYSFYKTHCVTMRSLLSYCGDVKKITATLQVVA